MKRLAISPLVFASAAYALGGVGFVGANLLMAVALPPAEFAVFSLAMAFLGLAVPVGPLGANVVVVRWSTSDDPDFLGRVTATGVGVAVVTSAIAVGVYDMSPLLALIIAVAVVFGSLTMVAAALYQDRERFAPSLLLTQHTNWVALAGAGWVLATGVGGTTLVLAALAVGYAVATVVGLRRAPDPAPGKPGYERYPWKEALAIVGVTSATVLLLTLERLIIPKVLSMRDLATFAVVAALVGSPYRMLQMGVGYTLLPRLRAASSVEDRRKLVVAEGSFTALLAVGGGVVVWYAAPWVVDTFMSGKYDLHPALMLAAVIGGLGKTTSAFSKAIVTAVGAETAVRRLNGVGWISVGVSTAGAVVGARWGLVGLMLGGAVGWFLWAVAGFLIGLPALRDGADGTAQVEDPEGASSASAR